jgi:5-methylcytosine-specific restriction enzyme A
VSTNRTNPNRGWCSPNRLPKGPNGRALCRQCTTEVPPGRRSFCSVVCVEQWKIKSDPGFVRKKVYERDRGVCGLCGVDTMLAFRRQPKEFPGSAYASVRGGWRGTGSFWQADHITPVCEGGGECDLSNLRTLCTACHRAETAALAKRRAKEKRAPNFELCSQCGEVVPKDWPCGCRK